MDPLSDHDFRPLSLDSERTMADDPMAMEAALSPTYVPTSDLWRVGTSLPVQEEVVFGPGVQLLSSEGSREGSTAAVGDIADRVNMMDIDSAVPAATGGHQQQQHDVYDDFAVAAMGTASAATLTTAGHGGEEQEHDLYDGLFCKLADPILQAPVAPPPPQPVNRTRKASRPSVSTRSSSRLAAKTLGVPVANRAQQRLMRELSFIDSTQQQASDVTVTEYLDMYAADLPERAARAIQAAARLGDKKLVKFLEAAVQEAGSLEMEA